MSSGQSGGSVAPASTLEELNGAASTPASTTDALADAEVSGSAVDALADGTSVEDECVARVDCCGETLESFEPLAVVHALRSVKRLTTSAPNKGRTHWAALLFWRRKNTVDVSYEGKGKRLVGGTNKVQRERHEVHGNDDIFMFNRQ